MACSGDGCEKCRTQFRTLSQRRDSHQFVGCARWKRAGSLGFPLNLQCCDELARTQYPNLSDASVCVKTMHPSLSRSDHHVAVGGRSERRGRTQAVRLDREADRSLAHTCLDRFISRLNIAKLGTCMRVNREWNAWDLDKCHPAHMPMIPRRSTTDSRRWSVVIQVWKHRKTNHAERFIATGGRSPVLRSTPILKCSTVERPRQNAFVS